MKRSIWLRLIAVILIISMLAAPVSAATVRHPSANTNGLIGTVIKIIRDVVRDIIDDWFDNPGHESKPTEPGPTPTEPPVTEPVVTDPTEPEQTEPTDPTEPSEPAETEPKVETVLELVEDQHTVENGYLLRGTTYTLSQLMAQEAQTAPYALRSSSVSPLADEGTTSGGKSEFIEAEEEVFTNWVDGGQYYIQCSRAFTTPVASWLAVENGGIVGVADTSSATPFTLTITKYGEYYLSATIDGAVKYLTFTGSSADGDSFSDTPVALTIEHMTNSDNRVTDDGNLLQIGYNGNYLNQHGGKTSSVYGAYDTSGDMGNAMWMYLIDGSETKKVEVETVPVTVKVVYFPVTMFNYNTDAINNATKAKEYRSESETWDGIYFSGGTPSGNDYVITIPGETTEITGYEVTYERVTPNISNNRITNLDANADYILVNKRSGRAVTVGTSGSIDGSNMKLVDSADLGLGQNLTSAPESFKVTYEAENSDSASLWRYATSSNYRYFKTTSDAYMTFTDSSSGTGTNGTALSFGSVSDDSNAFTIYYTTRSGWFTTTNYYLSDFGGGNRDYYRGFTTAGDNGNPFYIYKRVSVEPVTVTVPNDTTETYTKNGYAGHNYFDKGSDDKANGDLVWTGMAANQLDANENIIFNYPEGGIFSYDRDALDKNCFDGVKNVYEFVGMPFILTKDGHYIFDSDKNGVYFKDTDGDLDNDPAPGTSDRYNNMQFDYGAPQPLDITGGVADKSTNGWFPYNLWATRKVDGVDKTGYGTLDPEQYDNKNMDYHFGMRADLPFSMTANGRVKSTDDTSEEIIFRFSGDDDVWIYIDGQQVVDLGGMHNRLDIEIDFAKNTVTYSEHTAADENSGKPANNDTGSYNDPENWEAVQKLFKEHADDNDSLLPYTRYQFAANEHHELQFFYLERGRGTSNCRVEFNLPMTDTVSVTKVANESWSQREDDDDGDKHDGTYPLSDKEQAAVNEIDFGFTLYKQVAGSDTFEPVKNTNYYLVDADGNSILDSNGSIIIGSTNDKGHFYLRNGQTAKFMTEIPMAGVTYYVVEDKTPDGFLTPDFQFKGTATNGFDWYNEKGAKQNQDPISDASVIPEQEIPMPKVQEDGTVVWPEENKSYAITAYGSVEATDSLEFICVNYLNADLPNPTALALEDIIVIDYGLPVYIDPMANDLFRGDSLEIIAWGDERLTLEKTVGDDGFVEDYRIKNGILVGEENQTYQPSFHSGTVQFINKNYDDTDRANVVRDTFKYSLTKQLTEVEVISYVIKTSRTTTVNDGDNETSTTTEYDVALAKVYIVPATIMYYEENFGSLIRVLKSDGENLGTVVKENFQSEHQEPGVVGTVNDSTYGTDVAYLADSEDSNGTSLHFDTTNGFVRFQYTFKGTGTTFFARTGADTGYMQVLLFEGVMEPGENDDVSEYRGKQMATYYRDTYFEDTENLLPVAGKDLYNIPVYTADGLPYGTYTVLVTVAKAGTPGAGPNGAGDQFYLDGIRIMQPLNLDSPRDDLVNRALDAYDADGESNLDVITLRQKLITDFKDGVVTWDENHYIMLTDTDGTLTEPDDYIQIGPKEEVYLAPGQTVTFALKYWHPDGLKLYMGMKAPFGGANVKVGQNTRPLKNTVDSYYDVTNDYESLILKQEQIVDVNGNGLYYDSAENIYIKVKNADGTYSYTNQENEYVTVNKSELKPLMQDVHIVTYTFTGVSSIVSLTNIKVVGSYEFTIVPGHDIHIPGSDGGAVDDGTNPGEEAQP